MMRRPASVARDTPVDNQDHQVPFTFTGRMDKVTITLGPPALAEEDRRRLEEGLRKADGNA